MSASIWFTPAQEEIIGRIDDLAGIIKQAAAIGAVAELRQCNLLLAQETAALALQRALDGELD